MKIFSVDVSKNFRYVYYSDISFWALNRKVFFCNLYIIRRYIGRLKVHWKFEDTLEVFILKVFSTVTYRKIYVTVWYLLLMVSKLRELDF